MWYFHYFQNSQQVSSNIQAQLHSTIATVTPQNDILLAKNVPLLQLSLPSKFAICNLPYLNIFQLFYNIGKNTSITGIVIIIIPKTGVEKSLPQMMRGI